ncbi:hypothetical protein D3C87_1172710 [compost metagenome]
MFRLITLLSENIFTKKDWSNPVIQLIVLEEKDPELTILTDISVNLRQAICLTSFSWIQSLLLKILAG